MDNEYWLNRAIQLAEENVANGGGPFGAVIVRDGELIAEGVNRVTATPDPTAHAEVVAIRNAAQRLGSHQLSGCQIFSSCEPCPMCLGAIYWSRLEAIYFAASRFDAAAANFDDQFLYEEFALPFEQRRIPIQEQAHERKLAPFAAWQAFAAKQAY
ncbi:MAG: nucleoside deaminase [Bryobacter sp.]|nr:nucleoside deaminase [Bryobacter sp.]